MPSLNVEVAKNLVSKLKEELENKKFMMDDWFAGKHYERVDWEDAVIYDLEPDNYCFSTACAAGWLCVLYPEKAKELAKRYKRDYAVHPMINIGKDILEINLVTASKLFCFHNNRCVTDTPEEAVIQILEHMIERPEDDMMVVMGGFIKSDDYNDYDYEDDYYDDEDEDDYDYDE